MEPGTGEYIDHCDDNCGLGRLKYGCPQCKRTADDYEDGWHFRDDVYGGTPVKIRCEHCKAALVVTYSRDAMDVIITLESQCSPPTSPTT